jgi:hypothetical protein
VSIGGASPSAVVVPPIHISAPQVAIGCSRLVTGKIDMSCWLDTVLKTIVACLEVVTG